MPVNSVTAAIMAVLAVLSVGLYFLENINTGQVIKIVVKAKVEQNENNAYIRPYGNIVAVDNVWQQ